MNRTVARDSFSRLKFVAMMNMVAIFLFVVALVMASLFSLWQTVLALSETTDTVVVFGYELGWMLPWIYGVLIQYGQNVALYIKKFYCTEDIIAVVPRWMPLIKNTRVTSTLIALSAFWITAIVDAGTNVLWAYESVAMNGTPIRNFIVGVVIYTLMVIIVFAEELIGISLQAFRRSYREYISIVEREKSQPIIDAQVSPPQQYRQPVQQTQQRPAYVPQSRPEPTYHPTGSRPAQPLRPAPKPAPVMAGVSLGSSFFKPKDEFDEEEDED